ncbi:pilus assembly protein TadG-related protein [Streptomyces sp. N2A]|uniref:pilus assembly protein TadG-related protein n=1 Tax=Streptomyces sp. N2A TaxID=3073936 RepID=UPI00287027B5|nr:pilus assembly protein TadG-related protein [Streptomyces sp. N2A]
MKQRLRAHAERVRVGFTKGDDRGQVTAFAVAVVAALWLFAGIVVDGGLALAGKARALDVAQEAARSGAQQLDIGHLRHHDAIRLVRADAARAARTYVTSAGDSGSATVKGNAVTVQVTHRYHTQILQLIGLRTLTLHASGTAHAERATP